MKCLSYFSFIVLILGGCTRDQDIFIADNTEQVSQEYIHNLVSNNNTVTTLNITEGQETYYTDNKNFLLRIPANSVLDNTGKPVIGSIKILIHKNGEDKSDFIVTPSLIFDKALPKSAATYTISFIDPIKISKPVEMYLAVDNLGSPQNTMQYYTSVEQKWILSDNNIKIENWQIPLGEKTLNISGVKLMLKNRTNLLSFVNKNENNSSQYRLCINLTKKFNSTNSLAFFTSNDGKFHIKLDEVSQSQFCTSTFGSNQNVEGHIVVISDTGNQNFHFGLQNANISTSTNTVDVEMLSTSIQNIKAAIQSL
jgi:hypothetical protein